MNLNYNKYIGIELGGCNNEVTALQSDHSSIEVLKYVSQTPVAIQGPYVHSTVYCI